MPVVQYLGRRQSIPIIYTKGTHYEVGFDVGRTFGAIIQEYLELATNLNEEFLPAYNTPAGKKAYEDTLNNLKTNYPQYVQELEGTADGAKVPFYKLFLLHMDNAILSATEKITELKPVGCSTVCLNQPGQEILGHTEDALSEVLNHFYLVSAHIISDKPQGRWGVKEEKFTSLCYAGHLPGYTMGYNHHGFIFSINTLGARNLCPGKTPRHFITRSLLCAENFTQAQKILRDSGVGAADGCSINMTFLNQEGDRLFHNAEMGPAENSNESQLNILTANPGEYLVHCNTYLRLPILESQGLMQDSSRSRLDAFDQHGVPKTKTDVLNMLSDQTGLKYKVFQESGPTDIVKTIALGIFDCRERTWTLYADNPKKVAPAVILPLVLKSNN